MTVEIQTGPGQSWTAFQTITNRIADQEIDPVLIYRKIRAAHST